jgi:hypothetical protein
MGEEEESSVRCQRILVQDKPGGRVRPAARVLHGAEGPGAPVGAAAGRVAAEFDIDIVSKRLFTLSHLPRSAVTPIAHVSAGIHNPMGRW